MLFLFDGTRESPYRYNSKIKIRDNDFEFREIAFISRKENTCMQMTCYENNRKNAIDATQTLHYSRRNKKVTEMGPVSLNQSDRKAVAACLFTQNTTLS